MDDKISEETWDREEVAGCALGLDTVGWLLQQGGKLGALEELGPVAAEEEVLPGFDADAVLDDLLLLLPDEALTVES